MTHSPGNPAKERPTETAPGGLPEASLVPLVGWHGVFGLALIPKACSNCGVATYNGPDQLRPDAACWSVALVVSSWTTSCRG